MDIARMEFFMKRAFLMLICLFSCVGTDYVDDPIVGEEIIVSDEIIALMPGQQVQAEAEYFDRYGIQQDVDLQWQSSNPAVAEVDENGLITAVAGGQSTVQPSFENFLGPLIQITVVTDLNAVATVEITTPASTNLSVGDKIVLQVTVKNIIGDELPGETIEWFSENSNILTVTQTGEVEAVGSGIAGIHANVNNVWSNTVDFTVTGFVRTGSFTSAGGYQAVGTATLELANSQLILTLSDNFNTDFALGTFIYLANSTNGSTVRSTGFEVAQIFNDGGKTFNITQLNPNIGLNDYRYVIVLCKPASITFGFADLI